MDNDEGCGGILVLALLGFIIYLFFKETYTMLLIATIVFIIVLWISVYSAHNTFNKYSHASDEIFEKIKFSIKKRISLLKQLVDLVNSYTSIEKDVLVKISSEAQIHSIQTYVTTRATTIPNLKSKDIYEDLYRSFELTANEIEANFNEYTALVRKHNEKMNNIPTKFYLDLKLLKVFPLEFIEIDDWDAFGISNETVILKGP